VDDLSDLVRRGSSFTWNVGFLISVSERSNYLILIRLYKWNIDCV